MSSEVDILECTLRDGSYVIDFQFTAKDTALICASLERAGVRLIEIGHGLGLNASNVGRGRAAATDVEYMEAAQSTLQRAKWGCFFIPGIGRFEDLELAASMGMGFVRIGTNVTEVEQSAPYIARAKELGLEVSANLMKSYALSPSEFVKQAKRSESLGADIVCLVDSAGWMLPEDVRDYMQALKAEVLAPIGFHCHDNLSLGIANVLTAIEHGARYVDSTIQGMGRGGGNPVTEVLVPVLGRRGIDVGINVGAIMDASEKLIRPMLISKGWDPLNIISGYAGFHSSYLKVVLDAAERFDVDPKTLIIEICEIDLINVSESMVEEVAKKLRKATGRGAAVFNIE